MMLKPLIRIAAAWAATVCLTSTTTAAAQATAHATPLRETVDAAVQPVMKVHDVPGIAVAVVRGDEVLFFNYGVASRESGAPVTEHTLFELGSVSKTFTATLASYAQVLGKLSLSDHPGQYLPQLKGKPIDAATLLHLGTYTAGGLPLQFPDGVSDDSTMLRYFQTWKPAAAPGAQREYSNPSIGLFGLVTAQALHRDYADTLEHDLLPQLGLQHTYARVPEGAMSDYAWGYDKAGKPRRASHDVLEAQTYGVRSTAADMIRFVQLNIDGSRLQPPVRRAIAATHLGYFDMGAMVQGLGWEQYPYPVSLERLLQGNGDGMILDANPAKPLAHQIEGPRLYDKTGSTAGFGAYVAFVPEKRIGVVMLANRNFPIPDRVRATYAILQGLARMP